MSDIIKKYRKDHPNNVIKIYVDSSNSDYGNVEITNSDDTVIASCVFKLDEMFDPQRQAIEFAISLAPENDLQGED